MQPQRGKPQERGRFGLILLAAGGSTRLGSPKQLVRFRGVSLLRHSAEAAAASGASPIAVVLGAGAEEMRRELDGLNVGIVTNSAWEEGMSSSIRLGVATAAGWDVSALNIMLCDQPHVTAESLKQLMEVFDRDGKLAAVSEYGDGGALGPPCVFARAFFPELLRLRGQQGAKQALKELPESEIARVRFDLGHVDIDTPADVERLGR